jgi:hypothetical protein
MGYHAHHGDGERAAAHGHHPRVGLQPDRTAAGWHPARKTTKARCRLAAGRARAPNRLPAARPPALPTTAGAQARCSGQLAPTSTADRPSSTAAAHRPPVPPAAIRSLVIQSTAAATSRGRRPDAAAARPRKPTSLNHGAPRRGDLEAQLGPVGALRRRR